MSFKNEVANDLLGVFLNAEEFAEEHRVEGKVILCVVETNRLVGNNDGQEYGLAQADFVIHAKTADLPPRKAAGALLNLDGRELTVGTWDELDGITVVTLYTPEMV